MNQKIKISQLPAKGSNLGAGDLLEIAEFTGTGYISKSITGQEIIDAIPLPPSGITIGTTAITSGTVGRVLFEGTGNVVQESANLFWDETNIRLGIGGTPVCKVQIITNNFTTTPPWSYDNTISQLAGATNQGLLATYSSTLGSFIGSVFPANAWLNLTYVANNHIFSIAGTEALRIASPTRNVLINTTTDAGFRLDVNGTARVSGNTTVSLNQNGATSLSISNMTNGANAQSQLQLNSGGQILYVGKFSSSTTAYKFVSPLDSFISSSSGDIAVLNDNLTGRIKFGAGGSSTAQMTLFSTGNIGINTTTDAGFRLDVNGTARFTGAVTTPAAVFSDSSGTSRITLVGAGGGLIGTNCYLGTNAILGFNLTTSAIGSVSIGGNFNAVASAILDIRSTTKGFLPPRMDTTQKNAIASPATGLQVYDTTLNRPCFYDGTTWITL